MLLGAAGHGNLAVTDGDGGTVMLTLDTCKAGFRRCGTATARLRAWTSR